MRPDQRWFPTNRSERAHWFAIFTKSFVVYGPQMGFTASEIAAVIADNDMVQYLARSRTLHEAYISALITGEKILLSGRIGEVTPRILAPPSLVVPAAVPTGIYDRLARLVKRIRRQPGYTLSIGASLDILHSNLERIALAEYKPKWSAKALPDPYSFEIKFVKKRFKAARVEIMRKGVRKWEVLDVFTTSPAEFTIAPTTPGQPEMINVRIVMCESKTKLLGNFSDSKEITLTP